MTTTRRRRTLWVFAFALACDRGGGSGIDAPVEPAPTGAADPSGGEQVEPDPPATPRGPTSTGWTVEYDELGTLRIRNRNADVVRTSYAFFESGYRWADTNTRLTRTSGDAIEAALEIPALGVRGNSRLVLAQTETTATATLQWQFSLSRDVADVAGGGLDLRGTLVPALWGGVAPVADVSADGRRLTVGRGDAALRFELDGDAAAFTSLPGMPGVVRLVLLAGTLERGTRTVTMRVTLPAGGQIAVSPASRHPTPGPSWTGPALVHDAWPVDLSFLQDAPAGKHGHVRADGESFVFADGTPARFWGTNVSAYALFETDKAAIARQARRISAMGFNLVRLHHHDSGWVTPNVFEPGARRLRKQSLEALDWWIKCLSDEGIYIWLDLHVGREFRPTDGIGGFAELVDGDGRGFSYVNPRITALMDEFAAAYLDRRNVHTGRTIASDPAVAMVLLTNENDVTHHFASRMDPGSNAPIHEALFRSRVEAFAAKSKVSVEAALRVWEPGPAKLALAEIEHQWSAAAIGRLRKLGVRAPVVSTSLWGDEALYSVPSLVVGDAIDVHSYGLPESLTTNPHFEANFVIHAATGAVLGKPHTLSEYSVPPPAVDRYIAPTYVAAIAALQGWDAPLLFGYSQEGVRPSRPQQFSTWLDPSLMGLMPAAALIYRRQDVAPAKRRIVLAPSAKQVFGESRNAVNSAAMRTGVEQSQVVVAMPDAKQLAWDTKPDLVRERRLGATVITDLDRDLLAADATEIVSDTGELRRDFIEGRHVVSTPRSQVASGWIGGATIELGDGWVALDNPGATFALSSLDGEPLARSKQILVTAVGPSVPMTDERAEFRAAPIRGRFAVRNAARLELVPLATGTGSSGGKLGGRVAIAGVREGDLQVFAFDGKVATHWWILRPAP